MLAPIVGSPLSSPLRSVLGTKVSRPSFEFRGDELVVAKGGAVPYSLYTTTSSYTRSEARGVIAFSGQMPCDEIRLVFANRYLANGEQNGTDTSTLKCYLERTDGTAQVEQFLWENDATSKAMPAGDLVWTAPLFARDFGLSTFPLGSSAWRWQVDATFAVGAKLCVAPGLHADLAGEVYGALSAAASSQFPKLGDMAVPSGGVGSSNVITPLMIIGRYKGGEPMVILHMGDSVDRGHADIADTGVSGGGYFVRGTRNPGGLGQVAMTRCTRDGERVQYYANATKSLRVFMMGFHNAILSGYVGADGLGGRTFAQATADLLELFDDAHTYLKGDRIVMQREIQPYTSSTDGWTTPGNQTPLSGGEDGGIRDQINTWINDQEGVTIDYVFHSNLYWQNQSTSPDYHTLWANGKAYDQSHPSQSGQTDAGTGLGTFLAAIINPVYSASAAFSIGVTMSAAGAMNYPAAAAFAVGVTMGAAYGTQYSAAADFTVGITMAAAPAVSGAGAADFTISVGMTANGVLIFPAAAAFSVAVNMAAGGYLDAPAAAAFAVGVTMDAAYSFNSGSFEPNDIASYMVWLDSATSGSMAESGGAGTGLTTWSDKYGGGSYAATASSTARPSITTWNGIPVVRFNGSSNRLDWALPTSFQTTDHTIVIVYRKTNLGVGNQFLMSGKITGGATQGVGVGYDGTNHGWSAGVGGSAIQVNGGGDSNLHILGYKYYTSPNRRVAGFLDGTSLTTAGTNGSSYSPATFQIGRDTQTSASYFTGDILGILAFSDDLTNTQFNDLCSFLASYYNPSSGDAVWTNL